jgi:transketolase
VLGVGTVREGVEAAVRFGWDRYLGHRGGFVGMQGFGAPGPADVLYRHFNITADAVVAVAQRLLSGDAAK